MSRPRGRAPSETLPVRRALEGRCMEVPQLEGLARNLAHAGIPGTSHPISTLRVERFAQTVRLRVPDRRRHPALAQRARRRLRRGKSGGRHPPNERTQTQERRSSVDSHRPKSRGLPAAPALSCHEGSTDPADSNGTSPRVCASEPPSRRESTNIDPLPHQEHGSVWRRCPSQ